MKLLKRIFTALLILLILNLYLPKITFAEQYYLYAKADITKHKPEILSTPEEDIPTIKKIKKKTSGWTWVILLVLAGGLAALAGGGDGDDKKDEPPPPPDEGDVTVTW